MSQKGKLPIPQGWVTTTDRHVDRVEVCDTMTACDTMAACDTTTQQHIRNTIVSSLVDEPSVPVKRRLVEDTKTMGSPLTLYNSLEEKLSATPSMRKQQERDLSSQNTNTLMLDTIANAIRSSKTFDSRVKLSELNLDTVLSSTSYRNLMRQSFGTDSTVVAGTYNASVDIPMISRVFEESYMREPMHQERECARGARCECRFIDPSQPFTSVEFLTIKELGDRPADSQLCVVCSRKETQYLYYDMVFNKSVYNGVIQRYGNASGVNEYAPECLLRCTKSTDRSCMPKTIMSHQRNRYIVYRNQETGLLTLRQVRVSPHDYVSSASVENSNGITQQVQCMSMTSTDPLGAAGIPRPGMFLMYVLCHVLSTDTHKKQGRTGVFDGPPIQAGRGSSHLVHGTGRLPRSSGPESVHGMDGNHGVGGRTRPKPKNSCQWRRHARQPCHLRARALQSYWQYRGTSAY